jgi:hypothetical protein
MFEWSMAKLIRNDRTSGDSEYWKDGNLSFYAYELDCGIVCTFDND